MLSLKGAQLSAPASERLSEAIHWARSGGLRLGWNMVPGPWTCDPVTGHGALVWC